MGPTQPFQSSFTTQTPLSYMGYPTVPGVSTFPLVTSGNLHGGLATGRYGNLGGFAGVGNKNYGLRGGMIPGTPEGEKFFAEAAAKLSSKTTVYGGAQGTFDSGGLSNAAIWAGTARELNKNMTAGIKVERGIKQDPYGNEARPATSVSFWTLFKP